MRRCRSHRTLDDMIITCAARQTVFPTQIEGGGVLSTDWGGGLHIEPRARAAMDG